MAKHDFYLNLTDKKGREALFKEVTNTKDFLYLKLTALELLLSQWDDSCNKDKCVFPYMHLDDYNLHRMFIVSNNKIVSFGLGLTVQTKNCRIVAFRIRGTRIMARQISEAQGILKQLESDSLYCDIDNDDLEQSVSREGRFLFEYLLFEESGYVRYDYDKQTKSETKHPKHHIDVNFTPAYSYKIGLPRGIDEIEYAKILNSTSFCRKLNLKVQDRHLRKGNYKKTNLKKKKSKRK